MQFRNIVIATAIAGAGALAPVPALAATPVSSAVVSVQHHGCTQTSSGSCIRGGQFCPQAKYKKSGWDARGRHYVCKGNRTHPHWMLP